MNDRKSFYHYRFFVLVGFMFTFVPLSIATANTTISSTPLGSCPTSINFGETLQCSIDLAGEIDIFSFTADAGDVVLVRMSRTSAGLDPYIRLYAPDATLLCSASSYGESVDIASCTLPNGGTYTILAGDYAFDGNETGNYSLHLQRLNEPGNAMSIAFGQTISSVILLAGELDAYTFQADAGDVVLVRMSRISAGLDPYIRLYAPDATLLCSASSYGESVDIASCTLPNGGTHTILAGDYAFDGNETGDYSLFLACLTAPCNATLDPTITEVLPNMGSSNIPNDINIYGTNFQNGATIILDTLPLTTTYMSVSHLRAVVPAGLTAGIYDITVENPDGGAATLNNAYTVWDPVIGIDDLFSFNHELWTDPASPRANQSTDMGLVVHREGGQQVLSNVKVRFFLGDPQFGGTLIGDGLIPLFSPRSTSSTTAVPWTPPAVGTYSLFAVIDPDNEVSESFENNNVVSREVTVFPPASDQIAPHVDSFAINDDEPITTVRDVTLDTTASDPVPGTGVESVFYIEYEYSQAANVWVPAFWSGWLDYESSRIDYPWQLLPSAGVKYMQAWAADGAGNISVFPYSDFIAYQPASNSLWIGQSHIYRYTLQAGETLTAHIDPISGDPDLYVWAPDYQTRPAWVSNLSSGADEVSFIAPISGMYQVEVYGYTTSQYQITVEITPAGLAVEKPFNSGGLDGGKPEPGQPVIPLESVPGTLIALPAPPVTSSSTKIYLPIMVR